METQEVESNGGAVIVQGDDQYPFDAPTVTIQVPRGNSLVSVVLTKPEDKHYLALQQAARIISRVIGAKIKDETPPSNAPTEIFDELVVEASRHNPGEDKPLKEYTDHQCRAFPVEFKRDVITRLITPDCEVVGDVDDLIDDGLLTVRQVVGEPENPSYEIHYELNAIPEKQRLDYAANESDTEREITKKSVLLTTDVHALVRGKKLFAEHFSGVTGGRIQAGTYSQDLKAEYLKQIDSNYQLEVIRAAMRYYQKGKERARD